MTALRKLTWLVFVLVFASVVGCTAGGAGTPQGGAPTSGTSTAGAPTSTAAISGASTSETPSGESPTIRIGSKDFTEQFILGEMYALVLENAGFKVERKLNLGGTPVAQQALETNQIDLYPEYTGTGLLTVLKLPVNSDPKQVFDAVAKGYKEKYN